jgi:DNA polymerase theta
VRERLAWRWRADQFQPVVLSSSCVVGELCDHYRKAGIHTLHQWQAEALRTGGAMDGGSLVFTAPTSGGKTLVAEILLVRSYLRTGKKAIMVLPYVSIVTEKSAWLKKVLAPSGYRVEAFHGIQGGDIAKADLAICTMEKANALVNRMAKENQVSCLPTAPAWLPAGQVRRRRAVAHSLTHSLTH